MRLFTFGCSMTSYHYPTWADILGRSFDSFQNWGRPGAGNNYILNALNRCHLQNNFMPTDTVVILWTSLARIDYYQINEWSHLINRYYDLSDSTMPISCPNGYQWLSFAWMASAQHILENLNVRYKMLTWQTIDTDTDPYRLYQAVLEKITSAPILKNSKSYPLHPQYKPAALALYQRCAGKDWPALEQVLDLSYRKLELADFIIKELDQFIETLKKDRHLNAKVYHEQDYHPSPVKHLEWAKRYLPEFEISTSTEKWIQKIDHKLVRSLPYDFSPNFV
jgi:hypothetical protein